MTIEAERAVLGSILKEPELIETCRVKPKYFHSDERHPVIMEMLLYAHENLGKIDMVVMAGHWGEKMNMVGGLPYFIDLAGALMDTNNFDFYQDLIIKEHAEYEFQDFMADGIEGASIEDAVRKLEGIRELSKSLSGSGPVKILSLMDAHTSAMNKRSQRANGMTGARTASAQVDKMGGGHQKGDLEIVGARPSMGKTQYCLNDMVNAANSGYATAFFSAEMPAEKIIDRLISNLSGIDGKKIKSGLLTDSDWDSYSKAIDIIESLDMYIDDQESMSVEYIESWVKKLKKIHPNLIVYVDYLQLLDTDRKISSIRERNNFVSDFLKKKVARRHECTVVAISSIGRDCEKRPDKRPLLSDIKEGGDIEFHADVITFIYRDDYYNADSAAKGMAEIIIAKGRDIGNGTVEMFFNRKNGRFADISAEELKELRKKVREQNEANRKR